MKHAVVVAFVVVCAACGSSTPSTVYEQGAAGTNGTNGANGTNGSNGFTSLLNVVGLSAGNVHCANGGSEIQTGVDTNGDGVLEASEVQNTAYVCNGANGSNGTNGTNGANGTNGQNGSNAPGLVWLDSNNQVMPFINTAAPATTTFGGQAVDPNTGAIWSFQYSDGGTAPVFSPMDPNSQIAPEIYPASRYYVGTGCGGVAYVPWSVNAHITATQAGNANVYTATEAPLARIFGSYTQENANGGACQNANNYFNQGTAPASAIVVVQPPSTMGIPPYHQVWVE